MLINTEGIANRDTVTVAWEIELVYFSAYFEPLPNGADRFDLIQNDLKAFNFYGVEWKEQEPTLFTSSHLVLDFYDEELKAYEDNEWALQKAVLSWQDKYFSVFLEENLVTSYTITKNLPVTTYGKYEMAIVDQEGEKGDIVVDSTLNKDGEEYLYVYINFDKVKRISYVVPRINN